MVPKITFDKGSKIIKILSNKRFKLFLKYKKILALIKTVTMLILGPSKANILIKKSFKQSAINLNSLRHIKKIFVLLAKVVIVYI